MKNDLEMAFAAAARAVGIEAGAAIGYPEDPLHGDFSTNLALAHAKALKTSPRALAEKLVAEFKKAAPEWVASVDIAGPGFINVTAKDAAFVQAVASPSQAKPEKTRKKVMVEYTDPNPFKIFHIGHLMSNAIGESVSRLIEHGGAEVIRACYQGDVGLHVAKTVWAILKRGVPADHDPEKASGDADLAGKVAWLGERYVEGSAHDDDPVIQKEIQLINKKIFDRSDTGINRVYDFGRKASLEYFDMVYARLGTSFDRFFFESEMAGKGLAVVKAFMKDGVFEESDGAIVFKGEKHGLHTRVFVNSHGLPTYEAKEIGLNIEKFKLYPDLAESIIVTGNEINDYFEVLMKVLSLVAPDVAAKTTHLGHGMLRFASGKMSSRKGNIITAEALIGDVRALVKEKMSSRELPVAQVEEIADEVAVGAIKYSILRQAIGGDVIFDQAKSISFEGDSGPYLQYSAVRARSVLEKAKSEGFDPAATPSKLPETAGQLERLISRFSDIALRAAREYAPQQIAGYLIELAGAFNSYYAGTPIVDQKEPLSPYRIALTRSFLATMTDGLSLLGIKVPKKM